MATAHTETEKAIVTVVKCFYDYAGADGKRETLTLREFTAMANKEFPHLMKDVNLKEKLQELDVNDDNEMKFSEYWKLIGETAKNVKRVIKRQ
ncbi:protein S100-A13-like [Spea bombifrons]|uniref:protein S100-A13-like n=1 Tax=Spea bombifrons TaxID=233779 RepID=UPI002349AE47|nr:protein S100-A13-like [Spea bombifrons]